MFGFYAPTFSLDTRKIAGSIPAMNTPVRVVCDIGVHFFFDLFGCGIGVGQADKFLASLSKIVPR